MPARCHQCSLNRGSACEVNVQSAGICHRYCADALQSEAVWADVETSGVRKLDAFASAFQIASAANQVQQACFCASGSVGINGSACIKDAMRWLQFANPSRALLYDELDAVRLSRGAMSLNNTPCGEMPAWFNRLIDSLISSSVVTPARATRKTDPA
jgi:hypothetical protein